MISRSVPENFGRDSFTPMIIDLTKSKSIAKFVAQPALYSGTVKRSLRVLVVVCALAAPAFAQQVPQPSVRPAASHVTGLSAGAQAELVKQYCIGCHNDRGKAGELTLAGWNLTRASAERDLTEKMIH